MADFKQVTVDSLYYGFPVALLSTYDPNSQQTNITPVSSAWSLGAHMVLGVGLGGKCLDNLTEGSRFIASLPTPEIWESVEKIADTTGLADIPEWKQQMGYRYCEDKFTEASLTPVHYEGWDAAAITECPIHVLLSVTRINTRDFFAIVEASIENVYVHPQLECDGRINETNWQPLFYTFRQYFAPGQHLGDNFRYHPHAS